MGEGDEPPEAGEGQPAQHEAEGEDEAGPAPLDVHHGRKNVGQVAAPAFGHVRLHHVALAVLHDDALAHPPRAPSVLSVPGCCCCFCFFFRHCLIIFLLTCPCLNHHSAFRSNREYTSFLMARFTRQGITHRVEPLNQK